MHAEMGGAGSNDGLASKSALDGASTRLRKRSFYDVANQERFDVSFVPFRHRRACP